MKNFKKLVSYILIFPCFLQGASYEQWWENTLGTTVPLQMFAHWLGGVDAASRVVVRNYVREKGYKEILDVPCGLCIDYYSFINNGIAVDYFGCDITPKLVDFARQRYIPAIRGSIEDLPFKDSAFDMVYGRHILEHLKSYQLAIDETIRVARSEVLIVFFIPLIERDEDFIDLDFSNGYETFHNRYSRSPFEAYVLNNPKVDHIEWELVGSGEEEILHIYVK